MSASKAHAVYCFDVLAAHFEKRPHMEPDFDDHEYPLFVTWNILKRNKPQLRGCIGNFQALSLHSGLKEYALTSALRDRRFSPIVAREISSLSCSVSLLTRFEVAENYLDWEIGTHGIWIEFKDGNGQKRTATYLPDVMPEQGWTKEEAIDSLLVKGGHCGMITPFLKKSIILTRYQSDKCSVTYNEYLAYLEQNV